MRVLIIAAAGALLANGSTAQTTQDLRPLANYCLGADQLIYQFWKGNPRLAPPIEAQAALVVAIQRLLAFTDGKATGAEWGKGTRDAFDLLEGTPAASAAALQRVLRCRELLREAR